MADSFCPDPPVHAAASLCERNHCPPPGEVGAEGMCSPRWTGFATMDTGASVSPNFMHYGGGVRQEIEESQSQACPFCSSILQL